VLNRHGVVEAGGGGMMTLALGTDRYRLAAEPAAGPLPMLRAAVPADNPLLEALGDHRGPIELVVGDGPPLLLPPSAMVGEFIESCARGDAGPGAADDEAEVVNSANLAPADETP
jgi:hypothetical protein